MAKSCMHPVIRNRSIWLQDAELVRGLGRDIAAQALAAVCMCSGVSAAYDYLDFSGTHSSGLVPASSSGLHWPCYVIRPGRSYAVLSLAVQATPANWPNNHMGKEHQGWAFLLPTVTPEDAKSHFPDHVSCKVRCPTCKDQWSACSHVHVRSRWNPPAMAVQGSKEPGCQRACCGMAMRYDIQMSLKQSCLQVPSGIDYLRLTKVGQEEAAKEE